MAGYRGFEKKKSKLGTTLLIVGLVHLGIGIGLYWISQTEWGQSMIKVYKLTALKKEEPSPPAENEPEPEPPRPEPELPKPEPELPQPEPEPPKPEPEALKPEPEPLEASPPPVPDIPPPPWSSDVPVPPVVGADPFAIGKNRNRFAGYSDILTASIQAKYQQPESLPDNLEYAVLCELVIDAQGRVLHYRLVNSSGSLLFDQSALDALSRLTQVIPPPEGMDRTVIVKFFPPT